MGTQNGEVARYELSISELIHEGWLEDVRGGATKNAIGALKRIYERINQRCLEMFPGRQDQSMPNRFFRGGSNSDVISDLAEVWVDSNVRRHQRLVWTGECAMKPFLHDGCKDSAKLGRITIYRLDPTFYERGDVKVHVEQGYNFPWAPQPMVDGIENPIFNNTVIFARAGYKQKQDEGVQPAEVDAYIFTPS